MSHKFPYRWYIKNGYPAPGIKHHGLKVFGTFICGGGSTMGYKLAGYDHLGGVEIDPKMSSIYATNHNPIHLYTEDLREFNKRQDLPDALYNLDLLDGSPPCSTFSMCGSREKAWNKEKVFREGQSKQTLDDLVFVYCETINKLKPKVCLLENVPGIIRGNAKVYSKEIVRRLNEYGYNVQVFQLNAASMGVPQKRERVFFIGHRKEFNLPKLRLNFNEDPIVFADIEGGERVPVKGHSCKNYWERRINTDKSIGDIAKRYGHQFGFSITLIKRELVLPTIISNSSNYLFDDFTHINSTELTLAGSFPLDYNFLGMQPRYIIGMSVPPVVTAQISHQIYTQWLSPLQ